MVPGDHPSARRLEMLQATARILIAAAAIGLAIGGAAAPIGVAQAAGHGGGHAGGHSTPRQQAAAARHSTPGQQAAAAQQAERARAQFTPGPEDGVPQVRAGTRRNIGTAWRTRRARRGPTSALVAATGDQNRELRSDDDRVPELVNATAYCRRLLCASLFECRSNVGLGGMCGLARGERGVSNFHPNTNGPKCTSGRTAELP